MFFRTTLKILFHDKCNQLFSNKLIALFIQVHTVHSQDSFFKVFSIECKVIIMKYLPEITKFTIVFDCQVPDDCRILVQIAILLV